jgi:hypothetical protein
VTNRPEQDYQGFAADAGRFRSDLVPPLPYTAQAGQSIVKTIRSGNPKSGNNCYGCLLTAAVLTVVDAVPPGNGADVFRPPYVGQEKPYYTVSELRTELLPFLAPVANAPTLEWVAGRFQRVQLDHKQGFTGRNIHPIQNIPDYGADIGKRNGDAALRLLFNDPVSAKMPAIVNFVQYGIDLYHMVMLGQVWPDGGGHRPGQKMPMAFAAVMLDHQGMKDAVTKNKFFHEDRGVLKSKVDGRALFGFDQGYGSRQEEEYWKVVHSNVTGKASGFKSHFDPYGYVDGGYYPGTSYQFCCTAMPWKGSALAARLMPEMIGIWDNDQFFEYVDRWVEHGAWAQRLRE